MSLFFSKIRSVNVIISNMDGLYVMVGWTDCSSQKGHEPPLCTNPKRCCLYTSLKGVVFDGTVKTSRPLCTPPSVICVHLCVSEGFGLCEVIQDVKFYGLAKLVQVQSSVDLS
jgi:hypothetical protein